jgi:hypothetical protein
MVHQRPRRAQQSAWQARVGRVAVPSILAGLATTGIMVAATGSTVAPAVSAVPATAAPSVTAVPTAGATPQALLREQRTNRSQARPALPAAKAKAKAEPKKQEKAAPKKKKAPAAPPLTVVDRKYTRVALNVRAAADADAKLLTVLDFGSRLAVTGTVRGPWRYISYRGQGAWVKNQYLADSKPKPAPKPKPKPAAKAKAKAKAVGGSGGSSSAACPGGSAVERGLTRDAIRVHRAICARFPSVKSYGGVRADSLPEHPSGRALDAMISGAAGWEVARFVRANARQLGVSQVIYAQKIWTVQRGSEGWRSLSDRGSASANHYDHVHVTVYGSSGG